MFHPFKALSTVFFGLLFVIGGYCLVHFVGSPILEHAQASTHWPSVEGKITRSEVTTSRDSKGKTKYHTHVEYSYAVEGQALTNNVVWFGDDYSSSNRSTHAEVANRYPLGQTVKVFYDPSQPSLTALEPGAKFSSYVVYGIGWALTIAGVLIMLSSVRVFFSPV
jgi:hypothetical protein